MNITTYTEPIKLLVAGGCHVAGYPVGQCNGFVEIATKLCKVTVEKLDLRSGLHLGHAYKVAEQYEKLQPNTLIIQMGHFETTKSFRQRTNGSRETVIQQQSSGLAEAVPTPFDTPLKNLLWDVKNITKLQLAGLYGKYFIDTDEIQKKLNEFNDAIARLSLSRVIMLSPLPCADRVTLKYRMKLLEHFEESAKRSGFIYIDAMSSLLEAANGKDIYHDAIHLSHKGHALLGQLLAQRLDRPN